MSKGTSIKDAIKQWEESSGRKTAEETVAKLIGILPPIDKMDSALSQLSHVVQLSLSTNCIEKISNLNGFSNLKILSLGRNNIKSLAGLEPVAGTLEELWISYNSIDKLKGIEVMQALRVFYFSNNKIADWKQVELLNKLPALKTVALTGNPIADKHQESGDYLEQVKQHLTLVTNVDGITIVRADGESAGEPAE